MFFCRFYIPSAFSMDEKHTYKYTHLKIYTLSITMFFAHVPCSTMLFFYWTKMRIFSGCCILTMPNLFHNQNSNKKMYINIYISHKAVFILYQPFVSTKTHIQHRLKDLHWRPLVRGSIVSHMMSVWMCCSCGLQVPGESLVCVGDPDEPHPHGHRLWETPRLA